MSKFNRNAIVAAFSTMGRLVNNGEPVVFTKLEGLNNVSCTLFKEAVTHSFSMEKHGVDLKRIFIPNEDGKTYHFNTSVHADYRTAEDFIDRIMAAMSYVAKVKRMERAQNVIENPIQENSPKISYDCTGKLDLQSLSDDELTAIQFEITKEFERRSDIRAKQAKLAQVLELAEMSKEELAELLGIV